MRCYVVLSSRMQHAHAGSNTGSYGAFQNYQTSDTHAITAFAFSPSIYYLIDCVE